MSARIALACSFCHATLVRGEAVFCAACLAPHHADCVREHGGCSAAGCAERQIVRPGRSSRARRWSGWVVALGLLGVVLAQRQETRELEGRVDGQRRVIEILVRKLHRLEGAACEGSIDEHFRALVRLLQEQGPGLTKLKELRLAEVRQAIDDTEHVVSESTRDRWKERLSELEDGKGLPPLHECVFER